ncbi:MULTISPECIES: hypothetical protein [unclassified Micromonospora]|jgi:hypothetical protein|uniref:hypothetical protein n=1 Tax=Micromonospora TaxID=1873 RepID=UPI002415D27E|nr:MULTISPECIES: hypothetical protein [unclassified Micromonospora]MDG4816901.1 hypothetical protein [Micromonospora sp. WMMD956]WFE59392.1 hypothetical protein O7633_22230 [Micromonospora sp. WMMD712]
MVLSLIVNGASSLSAWLAWRLVPFAARLWTCDAESRAVYVEEWQSIVESQPGGFLKLVTAFHFLAVGALRSSLGLVKRLAAPSFAVRLASSALIAAGACGIGFVLGSPGSAITALSPWPDWPPVLHLLAEMVRVYMSEM